MSKMLIDSHCHLEKFHKKGELDAVLERASGEGVSRLITVGTSLEDWELYCELAASHPEQIYHTLGLHPCYVEEDWEISIERLKTIFEREPRPVALGEIGLDAYHLPKDKQQAELIYGRQRLAFKAQLAIACLRKCPVVVHSRGTFQDCIETIDGSGLDWANVVFHCFADGPEEVAALNERGGFASYTGIVTYDKADAVRASVAKQGLERLMIETDSPYLTPVPHRGKPNQPAFVVETARKCAEVLNVSYEELARATTKNTENFFSLKR